MRAAPSRGVQSRALQWLIVATAWVHGQACGGNGERTHDGGAGMATAAGSPAAGSPAAGAGGRNDSAMGGSSGAADPASTSGRSGASFGGVPACNFQTPQCPTPQAPCDALGTTQACFYWLTCHSAPGEMTCCDSGWEPGAQCPGNAGGAAGAGGAAASDPCGGCDTLAAKVCVQQLGGPGPSRFTCATQAPCGAADACACIDGQGTCAMPATGGTGGFCVCDNGLE
jgi:hypothetical protein